MKLFDFQKKALEITKNQNRVAYYHPMGSGKTFTGTEKMIRLGADVNLVICQKSKIGDWVDHFRKYYKCHALDLTNKTGFTAFWEYQKLDNALPVVGVINYELAFRRKELLFLHDFTLLLDESSMIQNENAKRSKFIMRLDAANVILLSGTPVGGRYERLWSQMRLLGWKITKPLFYSQYVDYHYDDRQGFPLMIIDGYKNVDRLKRKMRAYGCHFLTEDDVLDLPDQMDQWVRIEVTKEYKQFMKDSVVTVEDETLVGDTALVKLLRARQLCGQYNKDKIEAFKDLINSTGDRIIVFYNFNAELDQIMDVCNQCERQLSVVNGEHKDLSVYEGVNDSVTAIQYQAGAMGLNLQKANRIIYFTPPLSSELFEQTKKRIHRIGQDRTCFYYYLICKGSIEEKIYDRLKEKRDYTEELFKEDYL